MVEVETSNCLRRRTSAPSGTSKDQRIMSAPEKMKPTRNKRKSGMTQLSSTIAFAPTSAKRSALRWREKSGINAIATLIVLQATTDQNDGRPSEQIQTSCTMTGATQPDTITTVASEEAKHRTTDRKSGPSSSSMASFGKKQSAKHCETILAATSVANFIWRQSHHRWPSSRGADNVVVPEDLLLEIRLTILRQSMESFRGPEVGGTKGLTRGTGRESNSLEEREQLSPDECRLTTGLWGSFFEGLSWPLGEICP
mmetsp:Transcript_59579/g.122108  ORF Transcript_59579/g.122108 Transcript_59579/m.122108 type:complete len:255 (+) Transcript_59579:3397-4161(+)